MFTIYCNKCELYEETEEIDGEVWMYCGSPEWETDDWGNMVDFIEEQHCAFRPKSKLFRYDYVI